MLKKARHFFDERAVMELDCPILNATANIDDFIDPIGVNFCHHKRGYLHTSPELFMKKLLACGVGDVYFLGHVFRDHEKGDRHSVEFTMAEWYRHGLSYEGMIEETIDFVRLFFPIGEVTTYSYHQALLKYTGIDYAKASSQDLIDYIKQHLTLDWDLSQETFGDLLSLIFTEKVEPRFSDQGFVVLKYYPKEQSALAKIINVDGLEVAKRFELYYKGIELANGYDELIGGSELYERYVYLNDKRRALKKEILPIDEQFIEANAHLPECSGVAVGFDRLMMLRHQNSAIHPSMALIS